MPNTKKLPAASSRLARKITDLGLSFGIWVEPEMVSVDSDLYRKHPDWTIEIPGKPHAEGRNQRILDLGRREVQEYIIASMTKVFSSAPVSYVKWDMNRTFSDYYSQSLPAAQQGEVAHRYVLGLYRCMEELTVVFRKFYLKGVQQAETVLSRHFCAIFHRSGEAMTQMPVAGRTYRQITVTGIRSRR